MPRLNWLNCAQRELVALTLTASSALAIMEHEEDEERAAKRRRGEETHEDGEMDDSEKMMIAGVVQMLTPFRSVSIPAQRLRFLREWGGSDRNNFWVYTRFKEEDVTRMLPCLRIPSIVVIPGKDGTTRHQHTFSDFDILTLFLVRLSYPSTLIRLAGWLCWDETVISRAAKWVTHHIYDTFSLMLTGRDIWTILLEDGYLESSADAIFIKGGGWVDFMHACIHACPHMHGMHHLS